MRSCAAAFRFLTRLPVPGARALGEKDLARAVAAFPLVGAAIGGVLLLVDRGCAEIFPRYSGLVSAALMVAVYALLTGGLHHDGLSDVADAFMGRASRDERLRIMKDPRVGAMGVTALVTVLLVEFSALAALPRNAGLVENFRAAAIISFPVLGRWVMSYLCVRSGYARPDGTGASMVNGAGFTELAVASGLTAVALAGAFVLLCRVPLLIPILVFLVVVFAEIARMFFKRSLGGVTGDAIGASAMICECLILLVLASRLSDILAG